MPGAEGEALLAGLARAHKDIADDFAWSKAILRRGPATAVLYEAVGDGPRAHHVECFIGEFGGDDLLIAMITKYAASGRTYDGRMAEAVRAVALRHEPAQDGSSSFYIHPASVAQVRKFLFGLLRGTPQEAALAKSCLIAIDILRDEYGIAAHGPSRRDNPSSAGA